MTCKPDGAQNKKGWMQQGSSPKATHKWFAHHLQSFYLGGFKYKLISTPQYSLFLIYFYVFYRMKHVHLHKKIKALKQNSKQKQKQPLVAWSNSQHPYCWSSLFCVFRLRICSPCAEVWLFPDGTIDAAISTIAEDTQKMPYHLIPETG